MLHKVGNASKGVCILPVFTVRFPRGWGFNNDNSDFGFPRGRGDTNSAVIHGRVWIFFGISQYYFSIAGM